MVSLHFLLSYDILDHKTGLIVGHELSQDGLWFPLTSNTLRSHDTPDRGNACFLLIIFAISLLARPCLKLIPIPLIF